LGNVRQQVGTEQAYEEGEDGIPEERHHRGFQTSGLGDRPEGN
jgi:hypothetical protein